MRKERKEKCRKKSEDEKKMNWATDGRVKVCVEFLEIEQTKQMLTRLQLKQPEPVWHKNKLWNQPSVCHWDAVTGQNRGNNSTWVWRRSFLSWTFLFFYFNLISSPFVQSAVEFWFSFLLNFSRPSSALKVSQCRPAATTTPAEHTLTHTHTHSPT